MSRTTTSTIQQLESDIRKWKSGEINSDSMSKCLREAVYSFDDGVDDMLPPYSIGRPVKWGDLESTVDELRADVNGAAY